MASVLLVHHPPPPTAPHPRHSGPFEYFSCQPFVTFASSVPVHRRATARRVLSALHPAAAAAAKATNGQHAIRRCPDGNRSNSAELGKRTAGTFTCLQKRERERESDEGMKNDTRVSGWPEGGRCAGAANGLDFRICGCFSSQEAACAGAAGTVTPASRRGHLTYFSSSLWPKK